MPIKSQSFLLHYNAHIVIVYYVQYNIYIYVLSLLKACEVFYFLFYTNKMNYSYIIIYSVLSLLLFYINNVIFYDFM